MARIGVEVYDSEYLVQLADSDDTAARFNVRWQEAKNDVGTGRFDMHNGDAALAQCARGNIVAVGLDGRRDFAFVIESAAVAVVSPAEELGQNTTVSGRGTAALLEDAVVYPEMGIGRKPYSDTRNFNWASPEFDDSAWDTPVATPPKYGEVANGVVTENFALPAAWPDPDSEWIWDRDSEEDGVPIGDVYFRSSFTVAAEAQYRIWAAADDNHEVWLDGVLAMSREGPYGGQSEFINVLLDAGTHHLAVRASNLNALKAGFTLTVTSINGDGTDGASIHATNTTDWVVLGYPDPVPGYKVGKIIRRLISEAQTRGGLDGFNVGFDDDDDSDGTPWTESNDVAFPIGLTVLAALQQLAEVYLDWRMAGDTLTLHAYVKGDPAASGVTFKTGDRGDGANLVSLVHTIEGA